MSISELVKEAEEELQGTIIINSLITTLLITSSY